MSYILQPFDKIEAAVQQVVECEGECPATIQLSTLLRIASETEQPINLSAEHAEILESYF